MEREWEESNSKGERAVDSNKQHDVIRPVLFSYWNRKKVVQEEEEEEEEGGEPSSKVNIINFLRALVATTFLYIHWEFMFPKCWLLSPLTPLSGCFRVQTCWFMSQWGETQWAGGGGGVIATFHASVVSIAIPGVKLTQVWNCCIQVSDLWQLGYQGNMAQGNREQYFLISPDGYQQSGRTSCRECGQDFKCVKRNDFFRCTIFCLILH